MAAEHFGVIFLQLLLVWLISLFEKHFGDMLFPIQVVASTYQGKRLAEYIPISNRNSLKDHT